jgi:hypothetical protein
MKITAMKNKAIAGANTGEELVHPSTVIVEPPETVHVAELLKQDVDEPEVQVASLYWE